MQALPGGTLFPFGKEKSGRAGKRGTAWSCEEVVGEIRVVRTETINV